MRYVEECVCVFRCVLRLVGVFAFGDFRDGDVMYRMVELGF